MWDDVDLDGDMDLYVANDFGQNNLFENEDGQFTDVAQRSGSFDMAAGMGITFADVELDGDMDIYVSNMFSAAGRRISAHPNFKAGGSLEERMGYVHHSQGNSLLLNRGDGTYEDGTERSRSGPGGWAWGAMFNDFDNDGLADIVVPNGFITNRRQEDLEGFFWRCVVNESPAGPPATDAYTNAWVTVSNLGQIENYSWNGREPNYAYWNMGDGRFIDASAATGLDYIDDGRSACVVDWDGDGQLDLWLKNRSAPLVRFLRNTADSDAHYVTFELENQGPNRQAVGSSITVEAGGRTLVQRTYVGHGYLACSSRRVHFGLAKASEIERVEVRWPDGETERFAGIEVDGLWRLRRGSGVGEAIELPSEQLTGSRGRRVPERLPESPEQWVDSNEPAVTRVPLLDRLPLTRLELPRFDGSTPKVGDFAGRSLLVLLWGSWDDANVDTLRELAASKEKLAQAGVVLYPLSMDGVRDEPYVVSVLDTLDLEEGGGRVDRRIQLLVEMSMFEILGPFEDQPLPLGLLFDIEGNLSVIYLGSVRADEVVRDAALASEGLGRSESRWPTALTGGRWANDGPARSLNKLRLFLRKQGYRKVAEELRAEERRRAGEDVEER